MTSAATPSESEIFDPVGGQFPTPGAAETEALRARLVDAAEREGLLDVAYRTLDSPIGPLLVAVTAIGLVRVAFEIEDHDAVLRKLAGAVGPRILWSARRTDDAARQLDQYFAGTRRTFDVVLDLQLVTGFRRAVITHLPDIAYGTTESYAIVAAAAGSPNAVRAVGTACGHNPVPIVVPCHRVVRSDGSIGQYRGGAEAKATLLALEAG